MLHFLFAIDFGAEWLCRCVLYGLRRVRRRQDVKIGWQAAFDHLVYNFFALVVIYVIPLLRPVPLFCAEALARIASGHRWVLAVYLGTFWSSCWWGCAECDVRRQSPLPCGAARPVQVGRVHGVGTRATGASAKWSVAWATCPT